MIKVGKLIIGIFAIGLNCSVYGLTDKELQALGSFPSLSPSAIYSPKQVFIDFNVLPAQQKKYTPPLSLQETRARLKERLALKLNSDLQIGFDSFKASPIDRSIIDWPMATQPKCGRTRSHKGYGVGVRMKLD